MDNATFWVNIALYDKATNKQRAKAARVLLGTQFAARDCSDSQSSMGAQALADLVCEYPTEKLAAALKGE